MNETKVLDLYELMPALYRLRDAERGYPLRALLEIISGQADLLKQDIDGLWDDLFIETCGDWVIPYIGDLVGNNPLHEVAQGRRADVAKTIYYRRRKGTLPMLEELARDVTGWDAHAMAFFELLGWTQNVNHLRYQMAPNPDHRDPNAVDRVGTVHLRNLDALDRLDGPFDIISHTVDVRHICHVEGWHNIRNIGFFLWRLNNYRLSGITARRAAHPNEHGYHFSPLGNPAPLFTHPERETDDAGLAGEIHVRGPIRPIALQLDLENLRRPTSKEPVPVSQYCCEIPEGEYRSFCLIKDNNRIPPEEIVCQDLQTWARPKDLTYDNPDGTTTDMPVEVGIDPLLGRISFPVGKEPQESLEVVYNYGFSADMGGGPYDRQCRCPGAGCSEGTGPDTVADPEALDVLIQVPSTGIDTVTDALDTWDPVSHPRAVIQIGDNRTYVEDLTIDVAGTQLVVQAGNFCRPTLLGNVTVNGGSGEGQLALSGLLIAGGLHVQGNLGQLRLAHCTLVPGLSLDEEGQPQEPDRPSVVVEPTNIRLRLEIDHSIVGPLRLPEEMVELTVRDSIIHSPLREGPARRLPALVSGSLSSFPGLSSDAPAVSVRIGDEGPFTATFATQPMSLSEARGELQSAIQCANDSPAFTEARVITASKRLILLPGLPAHVIISPVGDDPTSTELRLTGGSERSVEALISPPLSPFPELTSPAPALSVNLGDEGPHPVAFGDVLSSVAQARDRLHVAIRRAHTSPAFRDTIVGSADDQLVVLPGTLGTANWFGATDADHTTFLELGLYDDRPAIAASDGPLSYGPPSTIERTTIFGPVYVKELALASEVIFFDPVQVNRRQAGCVRFSYVPAGSVAPRRYRCQPDLALEGVTDAGLADVIRARLTPSFTSERYGQPAYAQLSTKCAAEIRTGAEDGSEMGAFYHLKQPQREANLRIRLEEYLPFGLEAGLIYVS